MAFSRTYNPANVSAGNEYKPIPAGEYPVRITAAEDAVSKTSGSDMIKLELLILDGEFKGRKLWQYIVDDRYADQKVFDIMTSCGKQIPQQITSSVFLNLCGRVKTKSRVYQGEERAEVNYWIRPKPGTPAVADTTHTAPDDIPF